MQIFEAIYKLCILTLLGFFVYQCWPVIGLLIRVLNHIAKWFGS